MSIFEYHLRKCLIVTFGETEKGEHFRQGMINCGVLKDDEVEHIVDPDPKNHFLGQRFTNVMNTAGHLG